MCLARISEQTAIISLYSINWLDFITEAESVYYAVRTGSSNQIDINFDVLLTVQLSIFVSVFNQLYAQNLFPQ